MRNKIAPPICNIYLKFSKPIFVREIHRNMNDKCTQIRYNDIRI